MQFEDKGIKLRRGRETKCIFLEIRLVGVLGTIEKNFEESEGHQGELDVSPWCYALVK